MKLNQHPYADSDSLPNQIINRYVEPLLTVYKVPVFVLLKELDAPVFLI